MFSIPVKPVPSQVVNVVLAGQPSTINIYALSTGLYCDLHVNGAPIITGVICQHNNRIVRDAYLGFAGDLIFRDTQGEEDPEYLGLGSRWSLIYLEAADL